jgi:hypothetical protein
MPRPEDQRTKGKSERKPVWNSKDPLGLGYRLQAANEPAILGITAAINGLNT